MAKKIDNKPSIVGATALAFGAEGAPAIVASDDNPFPVKVLGGGLGGAGDASAANQALEIAALNSILAKIIAAPASEAKLEAVRALLAATLTVTGPLTNAQLVAAALATAAKQDDQSALLVAIGNLLTTANNLLDNISDASLDASAAKVGTANAVPPTRTEAAEYPFSLELDGGRARATVRSDPPAAAVTANIANANSLSAAIDLGDQRVHRISFPAAWTAADLTFSVSYDGANYADLWFNSAEVKIPSADIPTAAARSIVLDPIVFLGVRWLKLRSGTSAAPVNQLGSRDLKLVTVAR